MAAVAGRDSFENQSATARPIHRHAQVSTEGKTIIDDLYNPSPTLVDQDDDDQLYKMTGSTQRAIFGNNQRVMAEKYFQEDHDHADVQLRATGASNRQKSYEFTSKKGCKNLDAEVDTIQGQLGNQNIMRRSRGNLFAPPSVKDLVHVPGSSQSTVK